MPTSGVARRYARAVFEIAQQDNDLDDWSRDLGAIRDLLDTPATRAIMESPAVPTEAKLRLVDNPTKGLGEKPRNLVNVLVENRRTGIIADIVTTYQEELDRLRGIVHARVTTAVELSDDELANVGRRLESLTGRRVVLTTSVDPSILGGFVARIGDQLIDGSVVERLNALRESLMA